jgi:FkbH-like protein
MLESVIGQPSPVAIRLPEQVRAAFLETLSAIAARSTIVWGEHCTECAFPSCYSTCNFYTPRADHHCRRFDNGIERVVDRTAGERLSLTRIAFRRWGKLEGHGTIGLDALSRVRRAEHLSEAADTLAQRVLPRRYLEHAIRKLNDGKRGRAMRGPTPEERDVFLIEAWHENQSPIPFTLTVVAGAQSGGLFQHAFVLHPGYNRIMVAAGSIARHVDLGQPCQVQIEPVASETAPIVFGIIDFARLSKPLAPSPVQDATRPKIKCVVWDLDNTLWQGTLAEDGVEGISLNRAAHAALIEFDRRGILNSVTSKNDSALATKALEHFGLLPYFVFPQIGWEPKSSALQKIARALDIGLDTFAMIDDHPFERGEIAALCPEVEVFAETEIGRLTALARFDVPQTAESAKRRLMYKAEEQRQSEFSRTIVDYDAFLRSCGIVLRVTPLQPDNALRAFELSQRTNQLNVSGRRYTHAEIDALARPARAADTFVLSCSDRFGDYGAIGFCVLAPESNLVESFFLSCRVQRKRVENAFFALLAARLAARGHDTIRMLYRRTEKNDASAAMLKDLGFVLMPAAGSDGDFRRGAREPFPHSEVVKLVDERAPQAMPARA